MSGTYKHVNNSTGTRLRDSPNSVHGPFSGLYELRLGSGTALWQLLSHKRLKTQ